MRVPRTLVLLFAIALLGTLLVAGCSRDVGQDPSPSPATEPAPPATVSPGEEPPAVGEPGESVVSAFPWLDVELEDVQTGERFRISDYSGRPVLVKSFAVW